MRKALATSSEIIRRAMSKPSRILACFKAYNLWRKKTELQRNPSFEFDSTIVFSRHPDASLPELERLIGH